MPTKTKRAPAINLRWATAADLALIRRAAEIDQRSMNAAITRAALDWARGVLAKQEKTR